MLVAGSNATAAANAAAAIAGVAKVLHVDAPHFAKPTAENVAAVAVAAVKAGGYSHVLAPATGFGKNAMPRIAALLDVAQISDIIGRGKPRHVRAVRSTRAACWRPCAPPMRSRSSPSARRASTLRRPTGGKAEIVSVAAQPDNGLSRVTGQELSTSERPELTSARIVISGGRGLGSAENFKLLEALAGKLNAALGASRAAVDAGYVPNEYQVGQTGKIVAPDLYIAVGISGAIQHLAGMKDSKVIVAINKDPEAPIFQIADYGLVGDLFQIDPGVHGGAGVVRIARHHLR